MMNELKLASGETARYRYDPQRDTLEVLLHEDRPAGEGRPLAGIPRAVVERDLQTGEPVRLTVTGVQALILEHLVRDLLSLAGATEEPPPAGSGESIAAEEPPEAGEVALATEEPKPRRKSRRRRSRPFVGTDGDAMTGAAAQPRDADGAVAESADVAGALEASVGAGAAQAVAGPMLPTPPGFACLGLDPRLGAAVADMGFDKPTPVQLQAVPAALAGRDITGLAQTGTGKTMAFVLPALHRLLASTAGAEGRPRALVVTPTRELAAQVAEEAEALARHAGLRVAVVYGGAPMGEQVRALKAGADVVVATPGRLLDHVNRRNVRLDAVQVLVLDEVDRMLDMGFIPDIRRIVELIPAERQTLLFGATLPPEIESLSMRFQRDPVMIEVARQLPPAALEQRLYPVGKHLKIPLLLHLLRTEPQLSRVLVFAETKVETDVVTRRAAEAGLIVTSMHGDRPQRDRELALARLKAGEVQALIATNVAARGLDIEDVTHVINHDMPQTVDDYVHRIGRTARGSEAVGTAYTFVTPSDEVMVQRIESALGRQLPRVTALGFDYDVPTPSWARPSADDLVRSWQKSSKSTFSRSFIPRRR